MSSSEKSILPPVIGTIVGVVVGITLGFLVPFVMAQFDPGSAPALSFMPLIGMPVGGVVCGVIGLVLGLRKQRNSD